MRLGDASDLQKTLGNDVDGIALDPLWDRTEFRFGDNDIQLFYARWGLKGMRQAAIDAIDHAQAVVINALFYGELPNGAFAALVLHEPPLKPLMADEFADGLLKLCPSRRGACIFMLETKTGAEQVTNLLWSQVKLDAPALTPQALEVLKVANLTRQIRLPYVFWEWATPNIAAPLLDLGMDIENAFGYDLAELAERDQRMVMVDRRADAASFMELAKQLGH